MDYSKYIAEELYAIHNLFVQTDAYLYDVRLPNETPELLHEFASLDKEEREALMNEILARKNFLAYAESMGNADMADALQKVASDMAKMDSKELRGIAEGGLSKVTEGTSAQK